MAFNLRVVYGILASTAVGTLFLFTFWIREEDIETGVEKSQLSDDSFQPAIVISRCHGLSQTQHAYSLEQCRQACIDNLCCVEFQFEVQLGCWIGSCKEEAKDGDPNAVWRGASSKERMLAFKTPLESKDSCDLHRLQRKSCSPYGRVGTTRCSWSGYSAPGYLRLASDGMHLWGHGNFLLAPDDPVYLANAEQAIALKYAGPFELFGLGSHMQETFILSFNPDYASRDPCVLEGSAFDIFRSISNKEYKAILQARQLVVRWRGSQGHCLMDWDPSLTIHPHELYPAFQQSPAVAATAAAAAAAEAAAAAAAATVAALAATASARPLPRRFPEPEQVCPAESLAVPVKSETSSESESVPRLGVCYSELVWDQMPRAASPGRVLELLRTHVEFHYEEVGVTFFDLYATAADIVRLRANGAFANFPVNFVEWNHLFNETEIRRQRVRNRHLYQARQYKDCAARHRFENTWLLFPDIDEYMVTHPLSNPPVRWQDAYPSCFKMFQVLLLARRSVVQRNEGLMLLTDIAAKHDLDPDLPVLHEKVLANADMIRHIEVHWATSVDTISPRAPTTPDLLPVIQTDTGCPTLLRYDEVLTRIGGVLKPTVLKLHDTYQKLDDRMKNLTESAYSGPDLIT